MCYVATVRVNSTRLCVIEKEMCESTRSMAQLKCRTVY
jgi:hypothetical protein